MLAPSITIIDGISLNHGCKTTMNFACIPQTLLVPHLCVFCWNLLVTSESLLWTIGLMLLHYWYLLILNGRFFLAPLKLTHLSGNMSFKKIGKSSSPLFSADYHHKGYTSHWWEIFMVLQRQARWTTYLMPVLMKSCSTLH